MSNKKQDNRSAGQRLADLENAIMSLYNVADSLTRDFMVLRDAVKLLDNKMNSVIKASNNGEPLSDEVIDRIMTENTVAELKRKVENMVAQGVVLPETQVSGNSFLVGSELEADGTVRNPRLQFALKTLPQALQDKLVGVDVGTVVHLEDGKLDFKVMESYVIAPPKPPVALAPPPTAETPVSVADVTPVTTEAQPTDQSDKAVTPGN